MSCRNTQQQAFDIVQEREKIFASVRDESDLKNESSLTPSETTDFLARANDLRRVFCKSDGDPFQNDYLTRLIEMLFRLSNGG
ncbi:hypothetical protein JG687_00013911 [Phytophthora cactorum]|uniref:Uncharacterized protein n=1 Tax=Phytophthora cactorum TaxID=29920 RepID=A0A8T1TY73_9STRA|nr:hypothetical protein JG687_00013911 [Phytophthora cactorum]